MATSTPAPSTPTRDEQLNGHPAKRSPFSIGCTGCTQGSALADVIEGSPLALPPPPAEKVPLFDSPTKSKKELNAAPSSPSSPMGGVATFIVDWLHSDLNGSNSKIQFADWLHGDVDIVEGGATTHSFEESTRKLMEIMKELESMQRLRDQRKEEPVQRDARDGELARKAHDLLKQWIEERGQNLDLKSGHKGHEKQQRHVCHQKELLVEKLLVEFRDLQRENNALRKQNPDFKSNLTVTKGQILAKALSQIQMLHSQNMQLRETAPAHPAGTAKAGSVSSSAVGSGVSAAGAARIRELTQQLDELKAKNVALKGGEPKQKLGLHERVMRALVDQVSCEGRRAKGDASASLTVQENPRAFYIQTLVAQLKDLGGNMPPSTLDTVQKLAEELTASTSTEASCVLLERILSELGDDGSKLDTIDLEPEETSSC